MSEYQYYDFRALDKALTKEEQERVARISSRSVVNSHHAQFVYHYGDFHGSVKKLMAEYFDMMLYVANWGSQRLVFRIPEALIQLSSLRDYFISDELDHQRINKYILLDFNFNDEEGGGYWIEGEGMLDDFLPLREEIIQGDYRVLYLAWLKAAENAMAYEGIDEETREPKVPAGLGKLSVAQKKYAEWIELDKNLIKVAAENSVNLSTNTFQPLDYLPSLSASEKDDFLQRLCKNEPNLSAKLNLHLQTISKAKNKPRDDKETQRRTFFTLYQRYKEQREQFEEKARKAAALKEEQERAKKERQYQAKLDQLRGKEESIWQYIDSLVQQGNAKSYDVATEQLADLFALAHREKQQVIFKQKTRELIKKYPRRVAFIRRVKAIVDFSL